MSSSSSSNRTLIHTRDIKTQAFRRDDGLWDVEATLLDVKDKDFHLASGVKPKGEAIHQMVLTVMEKPVLELIMQHAGQNQSLAANYLGINRNTLRKKLQEHGLL